ncbi:Phage integrase, N-terminal SAM-like domain [Pseudobutyrivibrio sp. JW11]|uniref:tyrosine-type recombinase/integrase n=1 Tax=Pseudobutyrivibrio sp. JW11 TaxID=1855302 RepID=UPI0008E4E500|nr:integrase [Pseudobutyrivibrio sp. JW11]SFO26920.1 Phage integrase, N-terminal SAM-like domain [Pseudobutyrivibrio sp. JW11]
MRLPNGYGSVYKLSGRRRNPWVARKTIGWDFNEETQKAFPKYKFVGYYPTKQDAMIGLAEYNKDPYDLHFQTITFSEVFDRWSEEKYPKISHSNVQGYNASYRLCEPIKNMKMCDITIDHLQRVVDDSGKNTPTLKKLKILFKQLYDYCVLHDILSKEKADKIKYIDISQSGNPNARNRKPFLEEEIDMLWSVKDSNIYYSVILMLIYTGVRIGELLDLKKEDVHLEERWFDVTKSKTESGIRQVPIAEKVVPFFEYWMNQEGEYLVTTPDHYHFQYRNYIDSYWTPLMEELSLEHLPHDTRHTCISLLTVHGVDERIIKKIVGHKGQGVTETVYTHIDMQYKLEAINKI